jgi:hypothetical protein
LRFRADPEELVRFSVRQLKTNDGISAVAFTPDGSLLACVGMDTAHTISVLFLDFWSARLHRIYLSNPYPRILQVVDWAEGSLLVSMNNHRSPVHALMYEKVVTFHSCIQNLLCLTGLIRINSLLAAMNRQVDHQLFTLR